MQYDDLEIINKAKISAITKVRTADIYQVIEFHPETQTVDVEACVLPYGYDPEGTMKEDMFGEFRKMSIEKQGITIFDVPVQQFRCGQFSITAPLQAGDTGVLVFLKNDIERWKVEGNQTGALFVTPFNLNSCVFIPFIPNEVNKDANYNKDSLEIKSKSVIIRVNENTIEIETPDDSGKMTVKGDLEVTGNISATEDVKAGNVSLKDHTHDFNYIGAGQGSSQQSGTTEKP